ncbi:hypothetical protein DFQ27_003047 [Actinomortierella ambigua]|uniref:SPX domain-containing protein n=1 Tax=Actinomortierella ambigua TaxID=1343610 RepID=A0A9P6U5F7_9FUNG|nr:hypothetical protein DFQ27_003047 [Actinomortierella ambigua]
MKFAKQLGLRSIPSWAPYYLDYKSLKHYIKSSFAPEPLSSLESLDSLDLEGDAKKDYPVAASVASDTTGSASVQATDAQSPPRVAPDHEVDATAGNSGKAQMSVDNSPVVTAATSTAGEDLARIAQLAVQPKVLHAAIGSGATKPAIGSLSPEAQAEINGIADGFRALLMAELQKVNARYEAQEKIGGVLLERLNATWRSNFSPAELKRWRGELQTLILNLEYLLEFSQTNITGFKKIIKKFDKHYRNSRFCVSPSISVASSANTPDVGGISRGHHEPEANHPPLTHPTASRATIGFFASEPSDSHSIHQLQHQHQQQQSNSHHYLMMVNGLGIQGRDTPKIYLPRDGGQPKQLQLMYHYYEHLTALGTEFWAMVTDKTFAKSEKDERLLGAARSLWRKRTPVVPEHISPTLVRSSDPKEHPIVQDLDLDALPSGQLTRLWVVLAEDGMGSPIKVPVIVAKGVRPGPVVGLTAALHGNELNGIPLTHRLVLQEIQCQALHGIVVTVPVANVPGYLAQQRGYTDGVDLNRVMPGKKNGATSQVYAYNLMNRIVRHFTHLIDLHTASRGRVNSLYVRANMQKPMTRHMARLQNPQIIVHNTSPDGSLRGAAMSDFNIPAITVEIGDPARFQKRFVKSALLGVTNILSSLKMIDDEHEVPDYDPVVCAKSYWIFTKGGGILNVLPDVNTWVRKDELIATLHNIFGEEEHRYYAPEDGIVVGKSVDPVCQSGCRILHLGVVSDSFPESKVDDGHL